jgi:hypothetical protein
MAIEDTGPVGLTVPLPVDPIPVAPELQPAPEQAVPPPLPSYQGTSVDELA